MGEQKLGAWQALGCGFEGLQAARGIGRDPGQKLPQLVRRVAVEGKMNTADDVGDRFESLVGPVILTFGLCD